MIGFSKQKFRTKLFEICTQNEKKKKKETNKQSQSGRIRSDLGFFFHTSFARWVDTSYFYKKKLFRKFILLVELILLVPGVHVKVIHTFV